jgi:hypothetical protein
MITHDRPGKMQEVALTNFYSLHRHHFENVARTTGPLPRRSMTWPGRLGTAAVTSAAESSDKSAGLFITRYIFKRNPEAK